MNMLDIVGQFLIDDGWEKLDRSSSLLSLDNYDDFFKKSEVLLVDSVFNDKFRIQFRYRSYKSYDFRTGVKLAEAPLVTDVVTVNFSEPNSFIFLKEWITNCENLSLNQKTN